MNVAAALAVLVQTGVFEKMPKEGSITAKELGNLVNLEPSVIGLYFTLPFYLRLLITEYSTNYATSHWDWYYCFDWRG
jgi:hypothetical protein